jgi:hypothetical protein
MLLSVGEKRSNLKYGEQENWTARKYESSLREFLQLCSFLPEFEAGIIT